MSNDSLSKAVLDALSLQIAVLDQQGVIIYVNELWQQYGLQNGLPLSSLSVGGHYLQACQKAAQQGDSLAIEAADGIRSVLERRSLSFQQEYPSHDPGDDRWFAMTVIALGGSWSELSVISHQNITQRKRAETQAAHLALHDPLTGLANRLYLREFLRRKWAQSQAFQTALSLLWLDVDHFRTYNEKMGEHAGDECLVAVARVLKELSRRAGDLAVRYDGEQFVLLLGDCNEHQAQRLAELIRQGVEKLDLTYQGGQQRITVSIGLVTVMPEQGGSVSALFEAAERALAQAKLQGRNQVVLGQFEPLPSPSSLSS